MIRILFACSILCFLLAGCSWLLGGEDDGVAQSRAEVIEAEKKLEEAMVKLRKTEADFLAGRATEEQLAKDRAEAEALLSTYDLKKAQLDAGVSEAVAKYKNLPSIGGRIGGTFGPIGSIIGVVLGGIASGLLGWRKVREVRSTYTNATQAIRKELNANHPKAAEWVDDKLGELLPAREKKIIKRAKDKGLLDRLPTPPIAS